MTHRESIHIAGACGFWGEATHASAQLLAAPELDFLVYDYLAEITMAVLARARAKDATQGYAPDFVGEVLAPNIERIAERGVRVVSNAGGLNPRACADAIRRLIASRGLGLKVAIVEGDDLIARASDLAGRAADRTDRSAGREAIVEMFSRAAFPDPRRLVSINAYLGAFAIARALEQGADIVITGRCVDSALTLGPCIACFGWRADQLDLLAQGSLAGHLIECGPQATGGNFSDWRQVGEAADIGYPLVEIRRDGSFELFKPDATSGVVSPLSVGEQMLYEIGDPRAYVLPDVVCDFSGVRIELASPGRVRVSGARGRPAPCGLKVCATYVDGWRGGQLLQFSGLEAGAKARAFARSVEIRTRRKLEARGLPPPVVDVEFFGGASQDAPRREEITLKLAARHADAVGVETLFREAVGLGLATPPGLFIFTAGGRPKASPVVRLYSFLLARDELEIRVDAGQGPVAFEDPVAGALGRAGDATAAHATEPDDSNRQPCAGSLERQPADPSAAARIDASADRRIDPSSAPTINASPPSEANPRPLIRLPLIDLAVARSGDKGDLANIGVIARDARLLPWIRRGLTSAAVAQSFAGLAEGTITIYELPGIGALNIVLDKALGGGGIASLRADAQGKAYAQRLLCCPIEAPADLVAACAIDLRRIADGGDDIGGFGLRANGASGSDSGPMPAKAEA